MAYNFISGSVETEGSLGASTSIEAGTSVTAGTSFIIGSADINETELEILDGATISTTELNYLDITTLGTVDASKAVTANADKEIIGLKSVSGSTTAQFYQLKAIDITGSRNVVADKFFGDGSGITNINVGNLDAAGSDKQVQFNQNGEFAGDSGLVYDGSGSLDLVEFAAGTIGLKLGGTLVTSTAAELNLLDTAAADTVVNSKAVIYSAAGRVHATSVTSSGGISGERITLAGGGDGIIGIVGDTDLLTLEANQLDVAGVLSASLGISGSAFLCGTGQETWGVTKNGQMYHASWPTIDPDQSADSFLIYDATSGDVKVELIQNMVTTMAGTVTTSGLKASAGVLAIDIANMTEATIATTDTIVFNDQNGDVLRQETVDDLFTLGPALASVGVFDPAADFVNFLDGGATGDAKKDQWSDIATLIAGSGITATNGVLALDEKSLTYIAGVANQMELSEGINYFSGTIDHDMTLRLPAHTGSVEVGDTVVVKVQELGGHTVTITGSSYPSVSGTIDAEPYITLDSDNSALTFVRVDTTGSWMVM